ncbi:hypothetical protein LTR17_013119 [Elasticomyces elasticus]|nr:hypothetical protein LTR17_013119 [Elasticomyces elasticus]
MQELNSVIRDFASDDLPGIPPVSHTIGQQDGINEPDITLRGTLEDSLPYSGTHDQLCATRAEVREVLEKGVAVLNRDTNVRDARIHFMRLLKDVQHSETKYDSRQHVLADSQKVFMDEIAALALSSPTPLPETTSLAKSYAEVLCHQEAFAKATDVWQVIEAKVIKIANQLARKEQSFLYAVERFIGSVPHPIEAALQTMDSRSLEPGLEPCVDCILDVLGCMLDRLVRLCANYAVWSYREDDIMARDTANAIGLAQTDLIGAFEAADRALHAVEEANISMLEFWHRHQEQLFETLIVVTQQDILHPTSVKLDISGTTISPPVMSRFSNVPRFNLHSLATAVREMQAPRFVSI